MAKKKLVLEFSTTAYEVVSDLASRLSCSRADVVSHALSLYWFAVSDSEREEYLALVNEKNNTTRIIEIPGVES